ncbi:MAG: EamA family transporter [Clostridia bacterium]|nr:EamA family transporter [Clostridia bacterium]
MVLIVYLLIVLASVTQSATTKLFNRQSPHSTVFNAVKACTALLFFALIAAFGFTFHLPTLWFGLGYGSCLCLSMYAGFKALCLGPMALTSMLVSFSVFLPVVWGVTVGNEGLKPIQGIALLLLLLALFLTNADRLKSHDRQGTVTNYGVWLLFVGITFLCNGICSILQKQHQTLYPEQYSREFMFFAMLLCAVIFLVAALRKTPPREFKKAKGKRYGAISGIANGAANLFTLILAGFENASLLFPMISAGTLLASLICGRILFKEKLKRNHLAALGVGLIAIILLKL